MIRRIRTLPRRLGPLARGPGEHRKGMAMNRTQRELLGAVIAATVMLAVLVGVGWLAISG